MRHFGSQVRPWLPLQHKDNNFNIGTPEDDLSPPRSEAGNEMQGPPQGSSRKKNMHLWRLWTMVRCRWGKAVYGDWGKGGGGVKRLA